MSTVDDGMIVDVVDYQTAMDAATSVVFHHPELMTLGATHSQRVLAQIGNAPGLSDLARTIYQQAADSNGPGWAIPTPMLDRHGKPVTDPKGAAGQSRQS